MIEFPKTVVIIPEDVDDSDENCCGSSVGFAGTIGNLSSVSEPEGGESQGEVQSLRVSNIAASPIDLPGTTVVKP